jgi:homogentisate 1,2-dioxygenase
MFDTRLVVCPTRFALDTPALQADYDSCGAGFARRFAG